ncbi:MAG: DUF308 domain-containing protein [Oscillospiraceae bacterium]|nr:DUF308 domain-containing protein [Oscillospiraceae bacterium]
MDIKKTEKFLNTFGLHIMTIIAGFVLLVNPDGATALVTKLIGWVLVAVGAVQLVGPALKQIPIAPRSWIGNGLAIVVGVLLLAKPMVLSDGIGRLFGILLTMEGFRNLKLRGLNLLTGLTCAGGVLLILMPRTLTQTLFAVVGIGLMLIGMLNIWGKLSDYRRLTEPGDPNIIDADL